MLRLLPESYALIRTKVDRHYHKLPSIIMPDTSSSSTQTESAGDIASLYQELETAEKTADALEGRLDTLEKRLDELLEKLEEEEQASRTESK